MNQDGRIEFIVIVTILLITIIGLAFGATVWTTDDGDGDCPDTETKHEACDGPLIRALVTPYTCNKGEKYKCNPLPTNLDHNVVLSVLHPSSGGFSTDTNIWLANASNNVQIKIKDSAASFPCGVNLLELNADTNAIVSVLDIYSTTCIENATTTWTDFSMLQGVVPAGSNAGFVLWVNPEGDSGVSAEVKWNPTNASGTAVTYALDENPAPDISGSVTNDGPKNVGETITFTGACTDSGDNFRLVVCQDGTTCDHTTWSSGSDLICMGIDGTGVTPSCSRVTLAGDAGTNQNDIATCCDDANMCDSTTITIEDWVVSGAADLTFAMFYPASGCSEGEGSWPGNSSGTCDKCFFENSGLVDENQVACQGQVDEAGGPSFFFFDNQSSSSTNLDWEIDLNAALPSTLKLKMSQANDGWQAICTAGAAPSSGCVDVNNDSRALIGNSIAVATDLNAWTWADFIGVSAGSVDRNTTHYSSES